MRTLLLIPLLASLSGAQSNESKRVLILMQEDLSWPIFRLIEENVRTTLRRGLPGGVLIFNEHMDLSHFPDPMSQAQKKAWVQRKYEKSKLDLVIGVGDVPTDMFPSVPLVYLQVQLQGKLPSRLESHKDAASVWVELGARKTIEAARRFQPNVRQVVVLVGSSPTESLLLDQVRKQMAGYSQELQIIYLTNLGFPEVLKRVETLGPESIVLFVAFTRDADGRLFIAAEAVNKIAAVSGAPVYAIFDAAIGSGAVGGYVTRFGEMGKQAGDMGLQLLAGNHPQDALARSDYLFDWRQLQRWKISEAMLPAGSIVLNRQPNIWEQYRWYILGAIFLALAETSLLFGLLWQRAKKRRLQKNLLDQIGFERMLADLSTIFINLPEEQVGATIEKSLSRIANYLQLDRITIFEYDPANAEFIGTFSWHGEGVQPLPAALREGKFPWYADQLQRGETIHISRLEDLPGDASTEREYFRRLGSQSVLLVPLKAGDQLFGAMTFATTKRQLVWTKQLIGQLTLLGEVFSNALARKRAQEARFKHAAIVESSDDAIISKDLNGIILSWNLGAQHMFGYSETEVIGRSIQLLIPEELREEEAEILKRSRAGERIDHYETVRVTKSGEKLQVSLTIYPVKDSSGRIVGASKIARDITQQKRAEQALRKSEERFRLFMNHSPAVAWIKDEQGYYIYVSESYLEQFGVRAEDRCGKTDLEIYPSAIAEELRKNDQTALKVGHPIEVTEESIGSEGEPCTWLAYKFPFQDASGQVLVGGIGIDITERKKSEEILHNLTGRLIRAQEEERARIARELHDDFSQRLALLGIGLGQLWKNLPASKAEERTSVLDLLRGTREISTDLHSLSHQLHSSKLEHVGLVPALHGLCNEISEKYKIEVHFRECEVPPDLPKDVALCLFRVAQEALGNVVKHSRANSAQVAVDANADGISLRIADTGKGFDAEKQDPRAGIGLIGMRERLRLVGGTLQVRSGPGRGTEIWAKVALTRAAEEQLAKTQTAGT